MTDYYNIDNSHHRQQEEERIRCPNCKASITVEELQEYVNTKPESKREAIKQEIEMWGLTHYDRQYWVENVLICPICS